MRENQQLSSQAWFNTKLISPFMNVTHFACSWWVCIHQRCTEACTYILRDLHTEKSTWTFSVVYIRTLVMTSWGISYSYFAFLSRVCYSAAPCVQKWNSHTQMKLPLQSEFSCVAFLPSTFVAIQQTKPKTEGETPCIDSVAHTHFSCLMNVCLSTVMILKCKNIIFCFFVVLSEICIISELEDLSASVDVQDVYTKIKCKVGSFNIDHYRCR